MLPGSTLDQLTACAPGDVLHLQQNPGHHQVHGVANGAPHKDLLQRPKPGRDGFQKAGVIVHFLARARA